MLTIHTAMSVFIPPSNTGTYVPTMGDSTIQGSLIVTKKLKTGHMVVDDGSGNLTAQSGAFNTSLTVGGQPVLTSGGLAGSLTLTGGLVAEGTPTVVTGTPNLSIGVTGGAPFVQANSASSTSVLQLNPSGSDVNVTNRLTSGSISTGAITSTGAFSNGSSTLTTGAATLGSLVVSGTSSLTGSVSSGAITSTGAVSGTSLSAGVGTVTAGSTSFGSLLTSGTSSLTGAVSCGAITSSGAVSGTAITGTSLTAGTGSVTAGSTAFGSLSTSGTSSLTGTVSCGPITSSGAVSGTSITGTSLTAGTGSVTAGSTTFGSLSTSGTSSLTGAVSCGPITSTGAVTGTSLSAGTNSITAGAASFGSISNSGTSSLTGAVSCGPITSTGAVTGTSLSAGTNSITAGAASFGSLSTSGTSSLTGAVSCGPITSTGAIANGANSLTTGAITATGAFSNGTASMTTGAITSSGAFNNGTNTLTCGAITSSSTANINGQVNVASTSASPTLPLFTVNANNATFTSSASLASFYQDYVATNNTANIQVGANANSKATLTYTNKGATTAIASLGASGTTNFIQVDGSNNHVNTANVTVDDGTGALSANTITSSSNLTVSSGNTALLGYPNSGTASKFQIGSNSDMNGNYYAMGIAVPATAGYSPLGIYGGGGASAVKWFQVGNDSSTSTKNNVLDNGSGAATIAGNLTVSNNTLKNSSGNSITLPAAIGTLALVSQVPTLTSANTLGASGVTTTIAGPLTLSNVNQVTTSVGAMTFPASAGILALASQVPTLTSANTLGASGVTTTVAGPLTLSNTNQVTTNVGAMTFPASAGQLALLSQLPPNNWATFIVDNVANAINCTVTSQASSTGTSITVSSNTVTMPVGKYIVCHTYTPTVAASTAVVVALSFGGGSVSQLGSTIIRGYNGQASSAGVTLSGSFTAVVTATTTFSVTIGGAAINTLNGDNGSIYISQIA